MRSPPGERVHVQTWRRRTWRPNAASSTAYPAARDPRVRDQGPPCTPGKRASLPAEEARQHPAVTVRLMAKHAAARPRGRTRLPSRTSAWSPATPPPEELAAVVAVLRARRTRRSSGSCAHRGLAAGSCGTPRPRAPGGPCVAAAPWVPARCGSGVVTAAVNAAVAVLVRSPHSWGQPLPARRCIVQACTPTILHGNRRCRVHFLVRLPSIGGHDRRIRDESGRIVPHNDD